MHTNINSHKRAVLKLLFEDHGLKSYIRRYGQFVLIEQSLLDRCLGNWENGEYVSNPSEVSEIASSLGINSLYGGHLSKRYILYRVIDEDDASLINFESANSFCQEFAKNISESEEKIVY